MDVIAQCVKKLNDYKDDKDALKDYLDMMRVWFGDVLKYKSTRNDDELVFQESLTEIKQLSDHISFENINGILDEINKAEERTKSNVGFDSNMEVMLLGIKERLQ